MESVLFFNFHYLLQAQNKIGPDTVFLDQSVELTKDGFVDQLLHRYLDYASLKGALSLQSLYFVLLTNFAGLSMSLLTQPSAEEKVVGKIVSGAHPIRQYCASQLEALWECMLNNYSISVEERLFLMKGCLLQWFEVSYECMCMNVFIVYWKSLCVCVCVCVCVCTCMYVCVCAINKAMHG